MARLTDLPPELLQMILEVANVDDIEAFATCCPRVQVACSEVLEKHRLRVEQHSTVVVGWYFFTGRPEGCFQDPSIHPVIKLREIILDDKVRHYPKQMLIGGLDLDQEKDNDEYHCNIELLVHPILKDFKDQIDIKTNEVCETLGIDRSSRRAVSWKRQIGEGNAAALVVLLLGLYPNLEKLVVEDRCETWYNDFEGILGQIPKAVLLSPTDRAPILGNLSILRLQGDYYMTIPADASILPYFMALPSLKIVEGFVVNGGNGEDRGVPYKKGVSNVSSIDLEDCDIDVTTIEECLSSVRALEQSRYTLEFNYGDNEDHNWEPRAVAAALQK